MRRSVFFSIGVQVPLAVRLFQQCSPRRLSGSANHSTGHIPQGPFNSVEHAILSASIPYVPAHGFTLNALALGAKDVGYHDVALNMFPKGQFSIVHYHLVSQRQRLSQLHQDMVPCSNEKHLGFASMVTALSWARLLGNKQIIHRWQEALSLMALRGNLSTSLRELASLADDIWFLSGDKSVDFGWYSKRASLSAIYAAAELFMTTDKSEGFQETKAFLERRFEDSTLLKSTVGSLGERGRFAVRAVINILKSKDFRV